MNTANARPGSPRLENLLSHLLTHGILGQESLDIARLEQQRTGEDVFQILIRYGFLSSQLLKDVRASLLDVPTVNLDTTLPHPAALALIPRDIAVRHHAFPLELKHATECHEDALTERAVSTLTVALAHPDHLPTQDKLRLILPTGTELAVVHAAEEEIVRAIHHHYGHPTRIETLLQELNTGQAATVSSYENTHGSIISRLIDALLHEALDQNASDIHFEPEKGFLRIRYRCDGFLHQARTLHISHWAAMAVRLKVLARLDITETRAPQDGRFSLSLAGRTVDVRMATHPVDSGENIVLRLLDRQRHLTSLDALGLEEEARGALEQLMHYPEGLVIFTGPTGSGKTTTLYAVLEEINHDGVNIMTLEDPVEYQLPRLRQTSVSESTRINFADGIRSLLRQDPDILLVGEIRDEDTARMALRASMTGHLVFSTLHAHSIPGVFPRLADMGLSGDLLYGNLRGLVAQRLLRRLCRHCRQPRDLSANERPRFQTLHDSDSGPFTLHVPSGCEQCHQRGYRGRLAIMEILVIGPELEERLASARNTGELRYLLKTSPHMTLRQAGERRVLHGDTSLEELERVLGPYQSPSSALPLTLPVPLA